MDSESAQEDICCTAACRALSPGIIFHYYVMIFMSWAWSTTVWVLYVFHAIDPACVSSGPFGSGLMTGAQVIPRRNTEHSSL